MKMVLAIAMVSATVASADPKADRQRAIEDARKAGIVGVNGPKENYELFKLLGPILDCDGTLTATGKKVSLSGVMHEDSALDGMWLHEWFEGTAGGTTLSFDSHLAFDATAKQWTRVMVSNRGSYEVSHAPPLANGKLDWENDATLPGGKTMKSRTHLDASDPKQATVVGEASLDGGKTWVKAMEMTCKKPK